ncbi:MAG TPA: response regulator transcription factor [Solirubrobacteraceae bacterium]|jgi:DNA-binding NarL/FixJ family response regulator|nr:response regulator transcription factor [Solirubrobacteraceae bacterium]
MTPQAESGERPRVVIVDDHALFRAGVRAGLAEVTEIVGEAATVADAIAVIEAVRPDVVLLDVHMPDGGGIAVLRAIRSSSPATRVLALSVSDAPADVIALIRAGARGYVTKTISAAELADAVVRAARGEVVLPPRLAGFVLDAFSGPAPEPADADLDQLTAREQEVLERIARGYLYKEVAQMLGVSTRTVETHVSAVLRKLHLSNRHQLARWATEHKLVD